MKNKSTLLKIRKNENFQYLGNHSRKKKMQKYSNLKNQGIADKSFRQIRENVGIGR